MSKTEQNKIRYTVACVNEFAKSKSLTKTQAFFYLLEHKAISFLNEFYDVEHTLSFEDAISDLTHVSQQNGGKIQ
ncbi:MAG: DUF3791 domain-containing protein [Treponema sp.]|nr:DUF3791 domain-containing protein [Treponema sp.]